MFEVSNWALHVMIEDDWIGNTDSQLIDLIPEFIPQHQLEMPLKLSIVSLTSGIP